MSEQTAERWVTISAFIVAAVYGYRRITEATAPPVTLKKLAGIGELPPLGSFATAWGLMFLIIAIMTEAAPGLGGGFAILVATSDLLTNSSSVFADVSKQEQAGTSAAATSQTATQAGQQANVKAGAASTPPVQSGASSVAGGVATGVGSIGTTIAGGI